MSDKPKTPEEFSDKWCPTIKRKVFTVDLHLGAPQQYEEIKDPEIDDIIHSTWNAAAEVTRQEMQAEIDKRDAIIENFNDFINEHEHLEAWQEWNSHG